MTTELLETEQTHNYIALIRSASISKTKLSFTEKKYFRKSLQDYNLHQENTEDSSYGKIIQCLIESANEKHELPINYDYYLKTALGAAIGGVIGMGLFIIGSSLIDKTINPNFYISSAKDTFSDNSVMTATISLLGASIGVAFIHSIMEVDVFYDDALECLDYLPPQVIGSAPEYAEGD